MSPYKALFQLIGVYKKKIALSALFHILTAVLTIVSIPLIIPIFQLLFNRSDSNPFEHTSIPRSIVLVIENVMSTYTREQALIHFCILLVIVFFAKNLFRYLAMFFMTPVRNGLLKKLRDRLYQHFQSQNLFFFSTTSAGQILSTFSNDVQEVEWSILKIVETFFKAPLVILGSFCFMLLINAQLTFLVLALLLIVVIVIGGFTRKLKEDSHSSQDLLARMMSTLEEEIFAQKLIKSYQLLDWRKRRFDALNQNHYHVANKVLWRRDASSPLSEFLGVSIVIFLMWNASHLVFNKELEPETFFAFIFAFYNIIEPSKSFATAFFSARKGQAALERINQQLNQEHKIDFPKQIDEDLIFNNKITINGLYFKYADRSKPVFENINLEIIKNEVIGITGNSGAGKSTLMDLMLRFYDSQKGEILIDGRNINALSQDQLYSLFSVVDQNTKMFNTTVAENIALSDDVDVERMKSAAEKAGLYNFIQSLTKGFATVTGEKGLQLSGGQKQRIALARAVYKDAPIMIFDEATSAVDQESENLIVEACKSYFKNKTVIIIAHRAKFLNLAEKIFDLESGKWESRVN